MGKKVGDIISKSIYKQFMNGKGVYSCAKDNNVTPITAYRVLKKRGVRFKSNWNRTKNENYFEVINSDKKAYFLGFILSDGNISEKLNRIAIVINNKDKEILKSLKHEINTENRIRNYSTIDKRSGCIYKTSVLQFSSYKMKADLSDKGLNPDKSINFFNIKNVPKKLLGAFLRGMMDGDGSIGRRSLSLISTKEFLSYLNNNIFSNSGYIAPINIKKNVYKLYVQRHLTCVSFLNFIYKNATVYLKRKHIKYISLKKLNIKPRRKDGFKKHTLR